MVLLRIENKNHTFLLVSTASHELAADLAGKQTLTQCHWKGGKHDTKSNCLYASC